MDVEVTKKGILVKWHHLVLLILGVLGSGVGSRFIPNPTDERQKQEIEHRLVSLEDQLAVAQNDLASCKTVEDFLINQYGLDKAKQPARNTTRRVPQ